MFQPTNFKDGENIVIIDDVPHYRYTGVTYLERLKNGLTLDYVFQLQDYNYTNTDTTNNINEEQQIQHTNTHLDLFYDYELNYDFYKDKEKLVHETTRKGKRLPFKKRHTRNFKKTTIKFNGYTDKIFNINQHNHLLNNEEMTETSDDDNNYCSSYDDCSSHDDFSLFDEISYIDFIFMTDFSFNNRYTWSSLNGEGYTNGSNNTNSIIV